jgi:2-amino-4-hydroxy-6-hydroxymethyldihydropteridine diphosphokinase/dihydropteroate synthase
VVESPALLPEGAPADWNLPYLNLVVEGQVGVAAHEWLQHLNAIEREIGRREHSRWSPRPIDIDILLWGDDVIATPSLHVPHPGLHRRAFFLTPLAHLQPDLRIPNLGTKTVLQWSRELPTHIPLWMGIINVTPDSFSDGGRYNRWETLEPQLTRMLTAGAHIIDLGAESTRPRATPLSAAEEWERLRAPLKAVLAYCRNLTLPPKISVDTRHAEVAEKALALGVDMINDVSGLTSPQMVAVAKASGKEWVAMHQISIPADSAKTLNPAYDPCTQVAHWLQQSMARWEQVNLGFDRLFFDPGIGFGKNSLQSLILLRNMECFREYGLRLVVGHSRKSFLGDFSDAPPEHRDLETIGASLALCDKGVDVLRVHDIPGHIRAYRSWSHLQNGTSASRSEPSCRDSVEPP